MIEIDKTPRFKTADGQLFMTLEEAKMHAVLDALSSDLPIPGASDIASAIIRKSDSIIAILKMKPRKQRTAKAKNKPAAKPVAK